MWDQLKETALKEKRQKNQYIQHKLGFKKILEKLAEKNIVILTLLILYDFETSRAFIIVLAKYFNTKNYCNNSVDSFYY